MHNILLVTTDDRPFDAAAIEHILRSADGFGDVRFDEPGGAMIEAKYADSEWHTSVRLNRKGDTVSLTGNSDTALRAAIILQKSLGTPLRMFDTDYSFDLILDGLDSADQLRTAIERAPPN